MSGLPLLAAVAGAGALGAPSRFLLDRWVSGRRAGQAPLGTFVINLTGSFLLGFLTGLVLYQGASDTVKTVLGTGFCGAYTTFSTFSYETVRLVEEGAVETAVANAAGSLALGLLAAATGLALAWVL